MGDDKTFDILHQRQFTHWSLYQCQVYNNNNNNDDDDIVLNFSLCLTMFYHSSFAKRRWRTRQYRVSRSSIFDEVPLTWFVSVFPQTSNPSSFPFHLSTISIFDHPQHQHRHQQQQNHLRLDLYLH